jgi:hypothetical protein
MSHRITLIHAVQVAIEPIEDAFARHWPEAVRMNLLDDSLSRDRACDPEITPAMYRRFAALAAYAESTGAHAILYTCSAFGPAIDAVRRERAIPILKPNEAMFEAALACGHDIGLLATFAPSLAPMEQEFREAAAAAGRDVKLRSICVPEAMAALAEGDGATHDRLVAAVAPEFAGCDAVMLAQFSTARAREAVSQAVSCAVLTSPDSAVLLLRRRVTGVELK